MSKLWGLEDWTHRQTQIPATNFTATFAKVGYIGIKAILDNHQVNYKKYTITQASQVKEHWKKLE